MQDEQVDMPSPMEEELSPDSAQNPPEQAKPEFEVPMEDILLIRMGEKPFLVRAHDVTEIVRPMELTPVPMAPDHLLGLANIHGQIVCIIDPCTVLHLRSERHPLSIHTRYLILRHPRMHVGVWVEEVASIFRVPASSVPEEKPEGDQESLTRGEMTLDHGQFDLLNVQVLFR